MREKRIHNQIDWMSFLFCVLVVGVHSKNSELFSLTQQSGTGAAVVIWFESIVADVLGQIAVPGFFMISGYLFYRNFHFSKLFSKWKSRIFSLLIPYIVWNVLYYAVYCILSAVPALSAVSGIEGVTWSIAGLWDAIVNYTYNPVFWYLYQLLLLVLSAPYLYTALYHPWIGLAAIALMWGAVIAHKQIWLLNADALVYYSTAAYVALHGRKFAESLCGVSGRLAGVGCILVSILPQILTPSFLAPVPLVVLRLGVPVGFWMILKEISLPPAAGWMKSTFFVYAIHFLIVRTMNKLGALFFSGSALGAFLLYIIDIAAVFAIAGICRYVLRRWMPFLWRILSGGR
ncbi:MAG: acyltransferase family protein [bacterium]|nr:acyltransferase family protein [bacterium]